MKRGLLANLALAAAALVLAFAIPEAILRVVRPRITHDLFGTAGEHLPGLREMAAETVRYARARGIRQQPSFLEPSELLWSLKPNYDAAIARLPRVVGEKPDWRVRVNADGFRGAPLAPKKRGIRIVCLGDSIVFGDKLDQGETIPERIAGILAARHPGEPVEVINAAVPGYSSRQGLALWRSRVKALAPDVVVIAFGFNDPWPAAVEDAAHFHDAGGPLEPVLGGLRRTETYRAMRALILAARRRAESAPAGAAPSVPRVPLAATEANVRAIAREAREAGARAVIVHTAQDRDAIGAALERAARTEGVPFVDAAGALNAERAARQRDLAARRGLTGRCPEAPPAATGVLLRVIFPDAIAPSGDLIARAFGGVPPTVAPLADDGRGCDERAGDGVYTAFIPARYGARVSYVYALGARGGPERGEFDDFPWAWRTRIAGPLGEGSGAVAASYERGEPVDTYNRFDLMSESIHPDAAGAHVMAAAVAAAIEGALAGRPSAS